LAGIMGETAATTGMIFLILIGAGIFNFFIETSGMPQAIVGFFEELGWNRYAVLVLMMLFYIVLGCFMDSLSMILLTVPFIFPLVQALGFDPVWFGILLVTVVELGLITPPVGLNLFIIQGIAKDLRLIQVIRGIVPFVLADVVRLAILIAVPALALWLPGLLDY
jgi:TRAP-type C4-dicarboxylate transport system permease large subunit